MSDEQISLFRLEATPNPFPTAPAPNPDLSRIPTDVRVPVPPGTFHDMDTIKSLCSQCQRCDLGVTRTNAVIGRGNPRSDIMVIGEAPGENEDLSGLPFVGKAGQLLDKILAAVNLDSERDIYIGNICKCRPPGNRKPTPEEMQACIPYLHEQIRLVAPRIILLMGATAVQGMLGEKQGITKIRGEWRQWQGIWCMPMFHPAYLLRNQSKAEGSPKWLTWQDIKAVRAKYDELSA